MTKEGYRDDGNKIMVEDVPSEAIEAIAEVLTWACTIKKNPYPRNNWLRGMAWGRVIGSLLRHTYKFQRGEDLDKESGLPHTAHILANAAFLHTYYTRKLGEDNRTRPEPKPIPKPSAFKMFWTWFLRDE